MRGSGLPVYTRKRCLWYKLATCRYLRFRVTGCFMEVPRAGSSRVLGWVGGCDPMWLFFAPPSPGCCLATFIPSGLCYLPCVVKRAIASL